MGVTPLCRSTPRPLREQPMLRFPLAVNSSLAAHSAVQGNHIRWTESVNVAKVRLGRHLRYWELQDLPRWPRMSLDVSGLLEDNQGVPQTSSDDRPDRRFSLDFTRGDVLSDIQTRMKPIDLGAGIVAASPRDLASVILAASDKQVAEKAIEDAAGQADFLMSTDALNYWRMAWRCSVEWGTPVSAESVGAAIK